MLRVHNIYRTQITSVVRLRSPNAITSAIPPTMSLPRISRSLDSVPISTILISSLPFALTWLVSALIAQRRLYPILSNDEKPAVDLPVFNKTPFKAPVAKLLTRPSSQRLASFVFSTSIGLSTVLVELLLCELSNTLHPAARGLALRLTLGSLLVLSILVTPALEIHGWTKALLGASSPTSTRRTKAHFRLLLTLTLLALWLAAFWYIPRTSILRSALHNSPSTDQPSISNPSTHAFSEACLERIAIIGISLMASLSGFAAVSSLWQTFGTSHRRVSESEIQRKEAGLNATQEMLAVKQSRLRAVQRKLSESAASHSKPNFLGRIAGTIRGASSEAQEEKALEMEVSGLQTMSYQLSSSLSVLRANFAAQTRSRTTSGKTLNLANKAFALYCLYRILSSSLSSLRRWWAPEHSAATSDPVNNVLALLAKHYDPSLNRLAWSRQISFLLSGIMLLASFSAVLQTFRLFARFTPSLLREARTSLPLIISQVAGTYVIASALMLRSNLPKEMGGVISEALGAPLEGRFVEGWFESWFLVSVGLTAVGILAGKKVGGAGEGDDEDESGWGGEGKRS